MRQLTVYGERRRDKGNKSSDGRLFFAIRQASKYGLRAAKHVSSGCVEGAYDCSKIAAHHGLLILRQYGHMR